MRKNAIIPAVRAVSEIMEKLVQLLQFGKVDLVS